MFSKPLGLFGVVGSLCLVLPRRRWAIAASFSLPASSQAKQHWLSALYPKKREKIPFGVDAINRIGRS
jgi:hypothetical protein